MVKIKNDEGLKFYFSFGLSFYAFNIVTMSRRIIQEFFYHKIISLLNLKSNLNCLDAKGYIDIKITGSVQNNLRQQQNQLRESKQIAR